MLVNHLQRLATATRHAGQRIFGHDDRQASFFGDQLVEVTQQRATAGQHQAAFGDVGRKLGGRLLQRALDGRYDRAQRFLERLENLVSCLLYTSPSPRD